jgi:lysophospholipase L1-like esterase
VVSGTSSSPDTAATGSAGGDPALSVDPSTGLTDGQTVQVTGSGFAAGTQVGLAECETGATTTAGCSLGGATEADTDQTGAFSTPFVVTRDISVGGSTIDCAQAGSCVLAVGQLPSLKTFVTARISFAATLPTAPAGTPYYLALGDSLATGFGVPAGQGYVADLLAAEHQRIPGLQLVDLGCNGETTTTFISGGLCAYPQGSQLAAAEAFLASNPGQVALVTIDIGGDDIAGCASTTPPYPESPTCVAKAIATAGANLSTIGAALRAAAGPSVPIVGMNYYDPFLVEWLAGATGQAAARQSVSNLDQFNALLHGTYGTFDAQVADVAGTFSTDDFDDLVDTPEGTVPKNVAVACAWLLASCTSGATPVVAIHPNATGYAAVASAFEDALGTPVPAPAAPSGGPAAQSATLPFTGFGAGRAVLAGSVLVALGTLMLGLSRRRPDQRHRRAPATPGRRTDAPSN